MTFLTLACHTARAQVVYDGFTGVTPNIAAAPRNYIGQAFTISSAAGSAAAVQQVNVTLVNASASGYNFTRVRVQFWGGYSSTATPVFSAPLAAASVIAFGGGGAGSSTPVTAVVPVSGNVVLQTGTTYGISFNWQASADGTTFFDTDDLSAAVRPGDSPAITVGSNQNPSTNGGPGYYRNDSGRTDFNFLSSDSRSLGAKSGVVFSISAAPVPEPATLLLAGSLGLGALGTARRRTGRRAADAVVC